MTTLDVSQTPPRNFPELNKALIACVERFLEGTGSKPSRAVTLQERRSELVLQLELRELERLHVGLAVGENDISFLGSSRHCTVSLTAFRATVKLSENTVTITMLQREPEPRQSPAAAKNKTEIASTFERIAEQLDRPGRSVFLHRALNALLELSEESATGSLEAAATAPTDLRVLLRILEAPEILTQLDREDPLSRAKLRGIRARRDLLEAHGRPWITTEVAGFLNVTRQAVNKRRRVGRLLALDLGRRGYVFPSWQFTDRGVVAGLETVLEALGDQDAWMKLAFFVNPNARLDTRPPLEVLGAGDVDAVVEAARSSGEHGSA